MSKGQGHWRHYTVRGTGECTLSNEGVEKLVHYDIGIVETGRSRVFAGYFIKVTLVDGEEIIGEDGGSMIRALKCVVQNTSERDLRLNCVGLSPQWRQSGLSENTGWGYFGPQQRLMHMMEEMPDAGDEALDQMIREAVAGMRIGLV